VKLAYFAEDFPSDSETWIHYEIAELIRLGWTVRVFATRRPTIVVPEWRTHVEFTTYLAEVKKSLIGVLRLCCSPKIIWQIIGGLITDCIGIRQRLQVLRDVAFVGFYSESLITYKPDFVLAHFGATRANLALIWSIISGVPFGIKFHAGDVFKRPALLRAKAEHADKLMTISSFNVKFVREHYPDVDASRFKLHRCGIPIEQYQFQPKRKHGNPPIIMCAARLVPMKGFTILLYASKRLLEMGFFHKVKIYGEGPLRRRLEHLIDIMCLRGTVELVGYHTPSNLYRALLAADIFVLPCVFDKSAMTMDGIPVALMEAMAVGTPVISTSISGIPELITHGINGFLTAPGDPGDLADLIMACHKMSDCNRMKILRAARLKIETDHSVEKLSTALNLDLLESLRLLQARS